MPNLVGSGTGFERSMCMAVYGTLGMDGRRGAELDYLPDGFVQWARRAGATPSSWLPRDLPFGPDDGVSRARSTSSASLASIAPTSMR